MEPVQNIPPRNPEKSKKSIWDYESIVGRRPLEYLEMLAENITGNVQHINATYTGGGVAEILTSLVPLSNGLGVETEWNVIRGDDEFFSVTKSFHNALHGSIDGLTDVRTYEPHGTPNELESQINVLGMKQDIFETYLHWNEINSEEMDVDDDFVFMHDPQPAAMIRAKEGGKWIWRCHIDVSSPDRLVWNFLKEFVSKYDASVFSAPLFARPDVRTRQFLVPPSIDPLSDKNIELSEGEIDKVLDRYEIVRNKPTIVQVSRFDRLKDIPGTIDAYKLVKKQIDCQLIIAGGVASDDPEGLEVHHEIAKMAEGDPDVHVLLGSPPFSEIEINAFQRAADVIMQKSLKEGFGLVVSEGLWKGKPVVGGATGGIPLQIIDGVTGYLTGSSEDAAYHLANLLKHPELARRLGENGREHVRNNFLITRQLTDYLLLMISLDDSSEIAG
ncbi:glycosyl transferase family 1 [Methanosarcinales archaeon]|nr:MAG: glycosyl transferase family 1 [Methanosarcinales archaeon]